ncbi:MAG: hypothetical protein ISS43_01550 [Candidatus Omnitrophica bacterium]|nr:hypothetical protein [Candidatus Omnitrophota bacterium]
MTLFTLLIIFCFIVPACAYEEYIDYFPIDQTYTPDISGYLPPSDYSGEVDNYYFYLRRETTIPSPRNYENPWGYDESLIPPMPSADEYGIGEYEQESLIAPAPYAEEYIEEKYEAEEYEIGKDEEYSDH